MINDNIKSDNNKQKTQINRKKVMVVDDSALMRRVVCDIIEKDGRYEVADLCSDGQLAYDLLKAKSYDAVIMDIIMPRMTGLEVLEKLQADGIQANVVVASTLTTDNAKESIRALELGAVEIVAKPSNFIEARSNDYHQSIIRALDVASSIKRTSTQKVSKPSSTTTATKNAVADAKDTVAIVKNLVSGIQSTTSEKKVVVDDKKLRQSHHMGASAKHKIVALACSTGGPKALQSVIPFLPANLDAPVLVVQHMPEGFTEMMAKKLDGISKLHIKEAADGEPVRKGTVYIAPGGKHMNVVMVGPEARIKLSDEPLREGVKPCANYMYESLRSCSYDEITCVVLTGMGADGTAGIKALAQNNNIYCISQDAETCVVYGMPKAIYEAGLVNEVVPLEDVVGAIVKNVGVK